MNTPDKLDDLDDVDLAALSTRVLHDIVAKMTPEDRQRYRDALDSADAPLRSFLGAALSTPETSTSAPGQELRNLPWRILRHLLGHALPVLLGRKAQEGFGRTPCPRRQWCTEAGFRPC